jgi:WD40 repeat protein
VSLGKSLAELEAASLRYANPALGGAAEANAADFLVPRAAINTTSITALSVLAFKTRAAEKKGGKARRAPSHMNVIVTGGKDGVLTFYDSVSGDLIHEEKVVLNSNDAYVTSIAFEGAESPFLVVGGNDGSFAILRISLWRDEVIVAGKAPAPSPDPDHEPSTDDEGKELKQKMIRFMPPVSEAPSGYAVVIRAASIQTPGAESDSATGSKDILSLEVYSRARKKLVIAGSADGHVYVYQVNGTHLKTFDAPGKVRTMKRSGAMLAYNAGSNVHFILLSRLQESATVCQGAMSSVTGLLFDTLSSSTLYAATSSGDVFVFNTKYKSTDQQRGGSTSCKLIHTIRSSTPNDDGDDGDDGDESKPEIPMVGLRGYTVLGAC